MEIGTTITSITLVLICSMPFVLSVQGRLKREKQSLSKLKAYAEEQGCKISNFDHCGNFIIAIDNNLSTVFFQKNIDGEYHFDHVNLKDVKSCMVFKNFKTIKQGKHEEKRIDQLFLYFEYKNHGSHELECFDINKSVQLSGELQVVDKWRSLINELLSN